jgi:hypothetical protein
MTDRDVSAETLSSRQARNHSGSSELSSPSLEPVTASLLDPNCSTADGSCTVWACPRFLRDLQRMIDAISDDSFLDLTDDYRGRPAPSIHRWFGRRGPLAARAIVVLTAAPEIAADTSMIEQLLDPQLVEPGRLISNAVAEGRPVTLLDLCSGVGVVSEVALRLGLVPTAIDLHPIAVLTTRCALLFPPAYAELDGRLRGSASDRSWAGLTQELRHWSQVVLTGVKDEVGELWLETLAAVVCARVARCPACGDERPLQSGLAEQSSPSASTRTRYTRGHAACLRCGREFILRPQEIERWVPVASVADGQVAELPVPVHVTDVLANAAYPIGIASRLDEVWAIGHSGPIKYRLGITARQATILDAFRKSLRRAREAMADFGYAPDRIVALSTYLALAASDLVDYLCTGATWRQGRVQPALARTVWAPGVEFAEIGGGALAKIWQRRIVAMTAVTEANAELPEVTSVMSGDMTMLPLESESTDLIVWDPPYYDNINYDLLTAPWTSFLQSVIGELDTTLAWPHVSPSADIALPGRFDPEAYEQSLSAAAAEVVRVARPGARLGVFWISREAEDLQRFVDLLQPHGLELIQTIGLRTSVRDNDVGLARWETHLLILRVLKQARGPSGQAVDAERLLALSSSGQHSLYAGLADILAESWDQDEVDARVPAVFKGSARQRLAEFVAAQPDPTDLLRELGSSRLLSEAERLGYRREQLLGLDTAGLARQVMRQLGFTVPEAPAFSIGATLREAGRASSRLQLADNSADLTGSGMTAIDSIEHVLRFAVVTWCTHSRRNEWESLIEECLGRVNKLSFGDWVELFNAIPKRLASENEMYRRVQRMLKKRRVIEALQALVRVRNRLAHPEPGQDWVEIHVVLYDSLQDVLHKLKDLLDEAALPVVLQPVEEIRDRFSRFRLRLLDYDERQVELIVAGPTDLTKPKILLRSNLNPREVDPELLDANIVEQRMGLRLV